MVHIGKTIEEELKKQGKSASWLAHELYCDRTNVYSIFKRASVDTKLLFRIAMLLKCDFFKEYSAQYKLEVKQLGKGVKPAVLSITE